MKPIDKLRRLINGPPFNGSQAAFSRAISRAPSQVNQWLSGHRQLDLKGQKIIEDALNVPGYFGTGNKVEQDRATYAAKVVPIPKTDHPAVLEIMAMLANTDDNGKIMALGAVKSALIGYTPSKSNHSS